MGNSNGDRPNGSGSWSAGISMAGLAAVVGGLWAIYGDVVTNKDLEAAVAPLQARVVHLESTIDEIRRSRFQPSDWQAEEKWIRAEINGIKEDIRELRGRK